MRKLPSKAVDKYLLNIGRALTMAHVVFDEVEGFAGFEHEQQWFNFPNSLCIRCVFESEASMQKALSEQEALLIKALQMSFLKVGIKFRQVRKNIIFTIAV